MWLLGIGSGSHVRAVAAPSACSEPTGSAPDKSEVADTHVERIFDGGIEFCSA